MIILAPECELPGTAREQFQLLGKEEARAAWKLYQRGIIRELHFRADQHTAVLVLECTSAEETAGILATLPFVQDCLIGFDLIPLTAFTGFSRLFGVNEILD